MWGHACVRVLIEVDQTRSGTMGQGTRPWAGWKWVMEFRCGGSGGVLCWLILNVNLTRPRITWEERFNEGLSTSGWPVVMSKGNCVDCWGARSVHSGQYHSLRLVPGLNMCVSWVYVSKHYIHFSLLLPVDVTHGFKFLPPYQVWWTAVWNYEPK